MSGFGEAIAREYVTGTASADCSDISSIVGTIIGKILRNSETALGSPASLTIESLSASLLSPEWPAAELPLVCAVEGALLDLLCQQRRVDVYTLLDREPRREELRYGGTLPMLPPKAAENRC